MSNGTLDDTPDAGVDRNIRVVIAKMGLDGHTRGAKTLAKTFADSGMEVIYTGMRKRPNEVATMAVQEDVDVVGVSSLGGSYMTHVPELIEELESYGMADDVLLLVGGIIPEEDRGKLSDIGVDRVFTPDSDIADIIAFIKENV